MEGNVLAPLNLGRRNACGYNVNCADHCQGHTIGGVLYVRSMCYQKDTPKLNSFCGKRDITWRSTNQGAQVLRAED
jgi:hypothetical protein